MRILFLSLPLLWSLVLSAQGDSVLRVGLKETLPFVDIQAGQRPTGMSMLFWEMLNGKLAAKSEYHLFDSVEDMLTALERGEIDLSINPITVSEERLERLEFSQPFFISGTAMARPEENRWLLFLDNLFSWRFFSAIGLLALVILLFGLLVWLFERKKNPAQFQKGWRGIFDGFWWSAVTMTTVGYGDKAPVSRGGRVVAVVWMFAAILLISGLTAGVASALTVSRLESNIAEVEDLQGLRTGTVGGSSTVDYLKSHGVQVELFASVEMGLSALEKGDLEVFVFDRPALRFYLQQGNFEGLVLDQQDLKVDYYSFAYPKNSPLREELDPLIVSALKSDSWNFLLRRANARK